MKRIAFLCIFIVATSITACKNKGTDPVAPQSSKTEAGNASSIEGALAFSHGTYFLDDIVLVIPNEKTNDAIGDIAASGKKVKLEGKSIKCPPNTIDDPTAKCFEVFKIVPTDGAVKLGAPIQSAAPPQNSVQKIIFQTNSIQFKTKGVESSEGYCKQKCTNISETVASYMSEGWKVVSSTPRHQVIDSICTCDGVEYIISK